MKSLRYNPQSRGCAVRHTILVRPQPHCRLRAHTRPITSAYTGHDRTAVRGGSESSLCSALKLGEVTCQARRAAARGGRALKITEKDTVH
eukprot:6831263-Prymnesium_polylepis.2